MAQVGLIMRQTRTYCLTGCVLTLSVCFVKYFRGDRLGNFNDSFQLESQIWLKKIVLKIHFWINSSLLLQFLPVPWNDHTFQDWVPVFEHHWISAVEVWPLARWAAEEEGGLYPFIKSQKHLFMCFLWFVFIWVPWLLLHEALSEDENLKKEEEEHKKSFKKYQSLQIKQEQFLRGTVPLRFF